MKILSQWLFEYGESHQNPINIIIHKVCVPLIFWSIIGILWTVYLGPIRVAIPVVIVAMGFYFRFGIKSGLLMLTQILIAIGISIGIDHAWGNLQFVATVIFLIAWIGQFIGHKIENKKPSFFKDLQFLMIGPIWVFKFLFKDKK